MGTFRWFNVRSNLGLLHSLVHRIATCVLPCLCFSFRELYLRWLVSLSSNLTRTIVLARAFLCRAKLGTNTHVHMAITRVHKVSTEYFAAEQSPGNIERHVLQREDSDDDLLEADGREEVRRFRL